MERRKIILALLLIGISLSTFLFIDYEIIGEFWFWRWFRRRRLRPPSPIPKPTTTIPIDERCKPIMYKGEEKKVCYLGSVNVTSGQVVDSNFNITRDK